MLESNRSNNIEKKILDKINKLEERNDAINKKNKLIDLNKLKKDPELLEVVIDKQEYNEKVENEKVENEKVGRLYCTHCGHLFPKPKIPVDYIITCDKCYRPLDLPKKYYVNHL